MRFWYRPITAEAERKYLIARDDDRDRVEMVGTIHDETGDKTVAFVTSHTLGQRITAALNAQEENCTRLF
jgi:hypothetical protein